MGFKSGLLLMAALATGSVLAGCGTYTQFPEGGRSTVESSLTRQADQVPSPIEQPALGQNHLAERFSDQAVHHSVQGQYAKAEQFYMRALAILEMSLGPEHTRVAELLNNLARLYYDQRRYATSEPLFAQALAIFEAALGPKHPNVAKTLNNLATVYYAQNRFSKAELLYRRALLIFKASYGPDHPAIAKALSNLARLYHARGNHRDRKMLTSADRGGILTLRAVDASVNGSDWRVQLASFRTATRTRAAWKSLFRRYPDLFHGLSAHIGQAHLGIDRGTYHRLKVGPLASREAAAGLCARLKTRDRNQGCIVIPPPLPSASPPRTDLPTVNVQ